MALVTFAFSLGLSFNDFCWELRKPFPFDFRKETIKTHSLLSLFLKNGRPYNLLDFYFDIIYLSKKSLRKKIKVFWYLLIIFALAKILRLSVIIYMTLLFCFVIKNLIRIFYNMSKSTDGKEVVINVFNGMEVNYYGPWRHFFMLILKNIDCKAWTILYYLLAVKKKKDPLRNIVNLYLYLSNIYKFRVRDDFSFTIKSYFRRGKIR